MSKFISGRGNSTQGYTHGGRTTSFPRRQGYIDDRLGSGYEDDVPAMLTAGEYVIRRSSVQKYGEGFLNRLNQGLVSDDIRYMNQGGRVNNGRNDMPHMSRTRQQRRRRRSVGGTRRRTMNSEMGGNYTPRRGRTSARRTASPNRTPVSMNRPTRRRTRTTNPSRRTSRMSGYNTGGRVQRRRTANGRVQNFYHGGMAHSNGSGAMMTSTMNDPNNGTIYSGQNNGRGTMDNLLKYNGKYYDCHGSLYFTPECAEVTNTQTHDYKTGKIDTPKF